MHGQKQKITDIVLYIFSVPICVLLGIIYHNTIAPDKFYSYAYPAIGLFSIFAAANSVSFFWFLISIGAGVAYHGIAGKESFLTYLYPPLITIFLIAIFNFGTIRNLFSGGRSHYKPPKSKTSAQQTPPRQPSVQPTAQNLGKTSGSTNPGSVSPRILKPQGKPNLNPMFTDPPEEKGK